ncbi:MAG: glycosyltransferase family 1 protein [Patescibacteria group bacterium]|jgi:glycosyltransferase involved in cell wall biosynthesis
MRIGIDARFYGTKQRGIGRYVKKLVDGLVTDDKKNSFVIFLSADNFDDFKTDSPRVKKVLFNMPWYGWREQLFGQRVIARENLDLMHWPHFNVPYFYRGPFVVTIHDLIINHFPDSRASTLPKWLYAIKLWFYKKIIAQAAKKAKKIIAPSEFVKNDLVKTFSLKPEKVKVIYESYFLSNQQQAVDISRFKITKPFLFYVGAAYPHKNLEQLLKVWPKINSSKNYQLVLAGRIDYFYQQLKQAFAADASVIFTGFVADSELAALYQSAILYVFPSLYEGFGLPPVEAQAHGLAVVSANSSCLPEVLGQGAVYFDPSNESEMFNVINNALNDRHLRQQIIANGLKNVQRFSWDKMIKETRALYLSL